MHLLPSSIVVVSTLIASVMSPLSVHALGIDLGPFSIQLFPNTAGTSIQIDPMAESVCYAIETQRQLEIIVETKEDVNKNEIKIVSKKIVVEPYLFGVGREGQPILQGNIVDEKLLKEINIKYGDNVARDGKYESFFAGHSYTGKYVSEKDKNNVSTINFSKITDFRVMRETHFDAPEKLETSKDIVRVICQIHTEDEK